ncbi:dihydrolipoyllysine-residue succinyltransferase, E2 component of oxoglutarate dehydrogenase (succinyl-transferring) complex [Uncinocarpus reesii 1704]|uniref:Dihydrolipoamide acetyltransferase component of pyruvate dehydrogenase complex n=1 Tax=Uncinocarpus reesii (strain UAMH 1704) TaxID=336963 RepID=C4JWQ2_UNCRE|nr:dihydrolipoyllysine-residue succinyltransferase, E2 component of oxoglutarate dehydrogenase (succinyl-transferring) complex [Uncinocarpus reesii 1704]EEP82129.1 dihydrolipoyllysine-residue succinyltransferase, E2 component of oxoglutarate dehydrogenase (succinyl-transferring) complex [Uncinocarpus reesii 1704]
MAESISEGTLKQFSKQVGDFVERDEELATIETDKIDITVNAPESGIIKEFLAKEDDTVIVGQDLIKVEPSTEKPAAQKEKPDETTEPAKPKAAKTQPKEQVEDVKPAHPSQRKSDVKEKDAAPKNGQPAKDAPAPQPISTSHRNLGNRDERRVKMNRMRLRIAERLKQSQNTAASLTTFNEVDMSSLMELRKLYKEDILKTRGVKLGFMSAFAHACVLAMKEVPAVNASIEGPNGGDTIVYRDYVDISVAVATEKGLVTPVVRNVETMDLISIEKAIADLGQKARDNKLTIEDMAGGTFTISNMMYLALTYDHRLLDGREAVTFLVKVKEFIEDPRRMLLA